MNQSVKIALIIGGIIVGLLLVLSLIPGWGGGWGMMGPGMMGGFGIGGGLMGIFWLVVLGLAVWAIASWGRGYSGSSDLPKGDTSLEILKKRYARGEISKEEFEEKKKDLV